MSRRLLFSLYLFFICLALCFPAVAAPTLQPGFRTLGIWNPDTSVRMDLAVWYPARRSPSRVDYGDWVFSASRGAAPVEGQHPLVVLSHDSAGSRFSLHALASQLARNGFVVVAPTHAHDNVDSMDTLFTAPQVTRRARQINLALDIALSHPDVRSASAASAWGRGARRPCSSPGRGSIPRYGPFTAPERTRMPIPTARRGPGSA